MKHAIPEAVLQQHTAFLGKTGSGKTSTAKLAVEQILRDNPAARICVLDPIKSDWWGLTSSADGKKPGLPFHILGGPRGHVALHESAGKAIGELVAKGSLPLSIIDMADFRHGGLQQFFNDFAPALLKNMRGVVYLVIEEAHEIAPKERAGIGAESLAIHYAKKLATAGRSKGIRMMVITQRTQALHNALLGSCDTMIAHRLTAPADQEPVKKWLKANVSKEVFEKVSASMSSLKTGSGWICSGEAQVAELVQFPKISTFDNSATPTGDMADLEIRTAPVDTDKLRAIIGDAVKEAEADDPKLLRAEIARLTALTKTPTNIPQNIPDAATIAAAEQRGAEAALRQASAKMANSLTHYGMAVQRLIHRLEPEIISSIANIRIEVLGSFATSPPPPAQHHVLPRAQPNVPMPPVQPTRGPRPPSAANGDGTLSKALQNALNAIAWWHKIGRDPVEKSRACVVAGLSPKASTFGVYLAELAKRGLVSTPEPGKVSLTDAGLALATVTMPATADEIYRMAASLLGPQEVKVFDIIHGAYPNAISRNEVAERMGLSPTASTTGVYIAGAAAYGIVEVAGRGEVKAADWLFP